MSDRSPLTAWLLANLPLLAVLAVLAASFGDEKSLAWFFRQHRNAHPAIKEAMFLVSDWAIPALYAAWALLLAYGLRHGDALAWRRVIVFALLQVLVAFLAVRLLKMGLGRPRPWIHGDFGGDMAYQPFSTAANYHSLPSGHTTESTGASAGLAAVLGRPLAGLALGGMNALTGFSRIYLGEHHPTDVFFGLLCGNLVALGCLLFIPRRSNAARRSHAA